MKHRIMSGAIVRGLRGVAIGFSVAIISLPASAQGVKVSTNVTNGGKLVFISSGNPLFLPQGFTSVGLEYPTMYDDSGSNSVVMCGSSPNAFSPTLAQGGNSTTQAAGIDLVSANSAMTGSSAPLTAMVADWNANTVRFQISQEALAYEKGLSQTPTPPYTKIVRNAITAARNQGLIVILVMQTESYSCSPLVESNPPAGTGATLVQQKLPDTTTESAWYQLLNGTAITTDKGVMLEVFNEPNTNTQCASSIQYTTAGWDAWADGCPTTPTSQHQGMVTVGNYIEGLNGGISNVLIFDADNDAGGFTSFDTTLFTAIPANSAYTVHPFFYIYTQSDPNIANSEANWETRFGQFEEPTSAGGNAKAILATAWNESLGCRTAALDPTEAIAKDLVTSYLPLKHNAGLLGVGWDSPHKTAGYLVNSYTPYLGSPYTVYGPINVNSADTGCPTGITGADLLQTYFLSN